MTKSNTELGMLKGVYGWVNISALRSWTLANLRARREYYANPFIREEVITRPYNSWTKVEVAYLKHKWRQGKTYEHIAKHLGRTEGSVRGKAFELGLTKKR